MKKNQQNQTKNYFEKNSKNWSLKSNFQTKKQNSIIERNNYVLHQIKKLNLKRHLDIGCGSGDLCFASSKITERTVGIDFASSMIKIAKKKFKQKNLSFYNSSIFKYKSDLKFDVISANGFIEYFSISEIKKIIKLIKSLLKKNGYIILSSRNRLFNIFSLNSFSKLEIKSNVNRFKDFYNESVSLNESNLKNYLKIKKIKFDAIKYNQPKIEINVDTRHQFSPSQLVNLLDKDKIIIKDIHPINYHSFTPKIQNEIKNYKHISEFKISEEKKLSLIPFSSSFMILGKKK